MDTDTIEEDHMKRKAQAILKHVFHNTKIKSEANNISHFQPRKDRIMDGRVDDDIEAEDVVLTRSGMVHVQKDSDH